MANDYRLEEFVSNDGFKQIDKLKKSLRETQSILVDSASAAAKFNEALSRSTSAKEFSANADKAALAVQRLSKETANAQLAQAKLDSFQETITQKALARLAKEEAAQSKKTKTILSSSQAEVDAYNKSASGAGKLGTAVNGLDRAQAAAANSATQYSKANQQVAQSSSSATNEIDKEYIELSDLDKLLNKTTGTLKQNVDQQIKYEIELRGISQEQKKLRDAFDSGTLSEQKYITATSNLTVREGELKAGILSTNLAIRQQQKENIAAGGTTEGLQSRLDRLRTAYRGLTDEEKKNSAVGGVFLKNIKDIDAQIKKAEASMGNFTKQVGDYGTKAIGALTTAFIGFFAVNQLQGFVTDIFKVTAEFEKLESVLSNSLGSKSLAKKALDDIQLFAKTTPFGVQEVAGAFVKLANQGFVPTITQLKKLGDLTASTGKTFDQLAEAILDAQQGQFIRLREFGIRAEKDGDKVRLTFKGTTTEVKNTAESIRNYIVGLGELQGVSGAAAAVSKTLGGQVSNLADAFDQFLLKLGEGRLRPLFMGFVSGLTVALDSAIEIVKTYGQRVDDIQKERINKQVEQRKLDNDREISDRVDAGENLLKVQLDIYKREAALQSSLKDNDVNDLKIKNAQLIAQEQSYVNMRGGIDRVALQGRINDSKKDIRRLEYDLKLREFLTDDYNSKIATIEKGAAQVSEDEKKKVRDSEYLLAKQRLEIARDNAKEIVKDEKESLEVRIAASKVAYSKEADLLLLTRNYELKQDDTTANDKIRIREKYKNDSENILQQQVIDESKIAIESYRKAEAEFDKHLSKEEKDRLTAQKTALLAIEEARDNELSKVVGNSTAANKKRFDIEKKYALQTISLQIDQTEFLLQQYKIRSQGDVDSLNKIQEAETALAALRKKYGEEEDKEDTKGNKLKLKKLKKFLSEYGQAIQEVFGLISQLSTNLYNSQIQEIDQQQSQIDSRYENEKNNINATADAEILAVKKTTDSQETKETKILEIQTNAKAQLLGLDKKKAIQDADIERKKKQADIEKAKRDRAISVAQIIANTAIAVISQLSVIGAGFALAAAAAAVGAIQLATVLATPLPAYKDGGIHPKTGLALYGEVGEELYISPSGSMGLTPSTPTLGMVEGGTEFISNKNLKSMIAKDTLSSFVSSASTIDFNLSRLIDNDNKNAKQLNKALLKNNKKEFNNKSGFRKYV